ncbi:MAG: hypothetical protein NUW06_04320 [Candidatus Acetothermia bacterium]|jgi:uncharacterized repeat protein (TIGR01451 family)|nr:hypothetical protein [Candidatus Acetothermia bacterium]
MRLYTFILAGALLGLVFFPLAGHAQCTTTLDLRITSGPYLLVDSNKPGIEGPMVVTVSAVITNTGASPANDVYVHIGNGVTPGTFPAGSDGKRLAMLDGIGDATRYIVDLAAGESKTIFWQLTYPPTFNQTYGFTVWADNEAGCFATDSETVMTRSALTASANKLLGVVSVEPASGIVNPGNILTVTLAAFNFGQVGSGPNGEEDAWLQPVGNLDFDPRCFRLVRTEVYIHSIENVPPYDGMPYIDQVYFPGIGSRNPPPNYGFNSADYAKYYFIALNGCSTTIKPYNEVASGNQEKYSGDYGVPAATVPLRSEAGGLSFSKSVAPLTAEAGDTLTWTITYGNNTDYPIGDPTTGNGLVVLDEAIPEHTTYVAGSAACSASCIIFWSSDNGASWTTTEPPAASVTNIKWYINQIIPAHTDPAGTVSFQSTVNPGTPPNTQICNRASAMIDEADPLVADTVCANAPPTPTELEATKRDELFTDADGDGFPSPGDTLRYTIVIRNAGAQAANDVAYQDILDANLSLVLGSVTTTQGTVTEGNNPGDKNVAVEVGNIPVGGSVTITFRATIKSPLPEWVTEIVNQGLVEGSNFPTAWTDDPDTPTEDDPTITPITAAPYVEAYKEDSLVLDADGNGVPSPGDTIQYTITIINSGNRDGTATLLIDPLDANTTLVVGSVTTTQGAVTKGNNPGDTIVEVLLGTLPGGGWTATVTFKVTINDPLPPDVERISDQGLVLGSNFPAEPTDDPDTPGDDDPTDTTVTASPQIEAYKRASLLVDADGNGFPSPGDTLSYAITILNDGNRDATGVTFADTPDPNTTLVAGSVITSQGLVIKGNGPGDTTVLVDIGTIPGGGGTVQISFQVTINADGFSQVENQGQVLGFNFPAEPTDDPETAADDDPTVTPVISEPLIRSYKTDILVDDADSNGVPSPGDTLMYAVTIANNGNATATGVTFTDTPDPKTTLVVGSVITSQGTVISGNSAGDTMVRVDVGSIAPGGSANISFKVVIDRDGFTTVSNQGLVTGTNFPSDPTDDPDTAAPDDPTETKVGPTPPSPPPIGGDPPIYKDIVAFPTPELRWSGGPYRDFNGNGDPRDCLLRYKNIETGSVVNTGLVVSCAAGDIDIYEDLIAFVGQDGRIRYYNITTRGWEETGARGSQPSIFGKIIAFSTTDGRIAYFDLDRRRLTELGLPGSDPAIHGQFIAFTSGTTIHYYDLQSGAVTDTGAVGRQPSIYANRIAFATDESALNTDLNGDGDTDDSVIRYYDLAEKRIINTGAVGRSPATSGRYIAFETDERALGTDLNGDGDAKDTVIRYYDLELGQVFTTGRLGLEPDIYEGVISFWVFEPLARLDLNGDGDRSDPVVEVYRIEPEEQVEPLVVRAILGYPNPARGAVRFAAQGAGIREIRVEVFNLAGRRIYDSGPVRGNELVWRLLDQTGRPVANGVYLYIVTVQGATEAQRSEVRKLVVLK